MVVYFDYELSGLFRDDFLGISANDTEISWAGMSVYRIEDNRIAEIWFMFDTFGLINQMTAETG